MMMSSPTYTEQRQKAITELLYALRIFDWHPDPEIVAAIVDWHFRGIIEARTEMWVPGMAGSANPKVEEVLQKYYTHRIKSTIERLTAENVRLKQQVVAAADCLKYYASGETDGGTRANSELNVRSPRNSESVMQRS